MRRILVNLCLILVLPFALGFAIYGLDLLLSYSFQPGFDSDVEKLFLEFAGLYFMALGIWLAVFRLERHPKGPWLDTGQRGQLQQASESLDYHILRYNYYKSAASKSAASELDVVNPMRRPCRKKGPDWEERLTRNASAGLILILTAVFLFILVGLLF